MRFVFHLSSNIWAGLVAGFVFLVAVALTGRLTVAIAAAALFVLHQAHVEAIALDVILQGFGRCGIRPAFAACLPSLPSGRFCSDQVVSCIRVAPSCLRLPGSCQWQRFRLCSWLTMCLLRDAR